jgi:hypothetical protein
MRSGTFPGSRRRRFTSQRIFQSIIFDHQQLPGELRSRIYAWLDENAQGEKKAGDTPEQFYYKARKRAIGPFKREMWDLPEATRNAFSADLEQTFGFLFDQLGIGGTASLVREHVTAPLQHHAMLAKVGAAADDPDAGE